MTCLMLAAAVGAVGMSAGATLADGGTVKGKINFDGKMADQKQIRVAADAFCVQAHKDAPLLVETYVFNKEKATLCNVVVWVKDVKGTFEPPAKAVIIDQEGCQYKPHVTAAMVGQKVEFHNSDSTAHNLKFTSEENGTFNEGQPVKDMVKDVVFTKAEEHMHLACSVHAWMGAYIFAFDHPFFAVSDENGEFEIKGLPAGKYTLTSWHEFDKFSPNEAEISFEVTEGGTTEVDFTYHPPK